ncbi:hypothetical protein K3495_g6299 [Podosphaera aphanis]|nr:hypothetical protein K3495_g6299 [Podosphaera aphanis]
MASLSEPPLDEIQWKSPQTAMEMQGVHSNSVLFYFAQSPFFDRTSNNAVLFSQAMFNPQMMPIIQTREAFEGRLKTMAGLEFMVAYGPAEMAPGTGTGVWVIRKQTRKKRTGAEDEVTVHSSYFLVGENIYMAPSVADVISSRMLSTISSLHKFFSSASALPIFSPSLGHNYLLPTVRSSLSHNQQGTSQNSKENSPTPDRIQNKNTSKNTGTSFDTNSVLATRLLEESINIYLKYGDECMDENPITGEPGAFHLSSTGRKEKSVLSAAINGPLELPKPTSLKTDISLASKDKSGEKSLKSPGTSKPKRKKSKTSNGSISPA